MNRIMDCPECEGWGKHTDQLQQEEWPCSMCGGGGLVPSKPAESQQADQDDGDARGGDG